MKIHALLAATSLLFATAFNASAKIFYVDVSSADPVPPYTNWSTASTDIQSAIDVASDGDEILVTNGVYATGGRVFYGSLTNRVVINKAVTLQSVNGPTVTKIQGSQPIGSNAIRCVYMFSNSILSGFTLTNGGTLNSGDQVIDQSGGGVCSTNNNGTIITNCVLIGNIANQTGGGAYNGDIYNSLIIHNSAFYGGGAGFWSAGNGSVYGCLVVSNYATESGGGIFHGSAIMNCTIVGNNSLAGGGGIEGSVVTIANDIIYFNTIESGFGANYGGGSSVLFYCCTTPAPQPGNGSLTNSPEFIDYANGNFRLQSNSPCINGGPRGYNHTSTDLDGNPRIVDEFVDMGAYEYQTPGMILPYYFAQEYGLTLDGSIDSDSDGMNNWQEAIAGTNPTNAASLLKIESVFKTISGLTIKWQSANVGGVVYYLQCSTNLAMQPRFSTIKSNIAGFGGPSYTFYTDTTATNSGPYFYRVGVQ